MAIINPSVPNYQRIPTEAFRNYIFRLQKSTVELVYLAPQRSSQFNYQASGIEMILLVLAVKIIFIENKKEDANNFFEIILDELPIAISDELQDEILETYSSVRVFFGERMMFYKREFEGLLRDRDYNENEDWAYGVSDAAYIAIGMPLSDSDYIDSDEVAEFCQYALSEEDLYLPFITKVLEIALDSQPSIQFVNYEAALVNYFDNYQREYGEIKYKQILKAVLSANKAQKVLLLMDTKHSTPSAVDIIATVMSLTYFLFAKKTTIAIGSVFFLHTWHTNTNLKYQTLDDNELTALFIEVIQRSMKMV